MKVLFIFVKIGDIERGAQYFASQAVLVTNQVYAGSLGADALAAAAIGFTVSKIPAFLLLFCNYGP